MEHVYQILSITRQAYYKAMNKQSEQKDHSERLVHQAEKIRMKHHRMGCRKIARRIKKAGYGRDKTERLLLQSGFRIARKIKHVKTTQRQMEMYFPNLIQGLIAIRSTPRGYQQISELLTKKKVAKKKVTSSS